MRIYNGAVRTPLAGQSPEDYADNVRAMKASPEGFTIVKQGVAFHSRMKYDVPNFFYGEAADPWAHGQMSRGLLTERGLNHIVDCVTAMKEVLGDEIGLAVDCGPGFMVPDAIKLARALEPLNIMWLEDLLTGDYVPWVHADVYREVTQSTTVPIHTGEQIYLRHNFKDLIEKKAVRIVGPDPCDVGGIADLLGLAALVQVAATLPANYIAFEYPTGNPAWWYDIVEGLPSPIVVDGHIEVGSAPGMGVEFNIEKASAYLSEEDREFFD